MAGDDAELIGGIAVSIGASHAKLVSDLAEADRILEAWSKQVFTAKVGAQFTGVTGQPAAAPQRQQAPVAPRFAASATGGAQGREQSALIKAYNAELAKTGQYYDEATGEAKSLTAEVGRQRTVIAQVQQQAAQAVPLNIETKGLQDSLNALLATMKELVDTAAQLAKTPVAAPGGAGGGAARRTSASTAARQNNDAQARAAFLNGPILPGAGSPVIASATIEPLRGPGSPEPPRGAPVRPKTDRERAEQAQRDRETAERFNRPGPSQDEQRARTQAERANVAQGNRLSRQTQSFEERQQRAEQSRAFQQAEIVRRQEQQQASQEAAVTAAGRTSRTTASALGSFIFGPRREQIAAQTALAAAQRETASATRYRNVFENELIKNEVKAQHATRDEALALRDRNKEIRSSAQYTDSVAQQTKALEGEAVATQRVAKLSEGLGTAARSLTAVTVAGAAFGVGLKVIDVAIGAVVPALQEFVDIQTGFGATSTKVTSALGAQTLALKGNVAAALASSEAQAGLSTSASDYLDAQLKLTTQIKAGAQAQQQASELFKAGAGAGNAPSGLFGGYGGVGGTALFGQQLGGGRGFTEQVAKDLSSFKNGGGPDLLGNLNYGLAYATNPDVRTTAGQLAQDQNNPVGQGIDFLSKIPGAIASPQDTANTLLKNVQGLVNPQPVSAIPAPEAAPNQQTVAYLKDLNNAAERGSKALNAASQATYEYTTDTKEITKATQAAAAAGDVNGVTMAQLNHVVVKLNGAVIDAADGVDAYNKAIEQFAVGRSIQDPGEIGRLAAAQERQRQIESKASIGALQQQQAFAQPAFESNLRRTTGQQLNIQIPAQQALQNLISPPTPVGTGLRAANAKEQRQINAETKVTQGLQDQLNVEYAKGQQILEDTYKPQIIQTFGAAAGQAFSQLLGQITATGQEIAKIQAGITNEQAGYAVAQYNFQLMIAKRTLGDIEGLTGQNYGVQKTQLGVLEGQNLALSRQAQLLQFGLSQRQINLQTAVAGFTVPGLTPAEQNARVTEAKVEADYAQKQLDIQTKMFHNQVKIVDIGNLRQGADLLKQIGLLQRGRQVTLDTAAAQQKLERLNKLQQQQVAKVSTYINAVDAVVSHTNELIAQQETALGRALNSIEVQAVAVATHVGRAFFVAASGGFLGGGGASSHANGDLNNTTGHGHASGFIGKTNGMTPLGPGDYAGEANNEVVAILRNPRALTGSGGSEGHITINFNGDNVFRTEADFQRMYRMVVTALGKEAAGKGLRTPF